MGKPVRTQGCPECGGVMKYEHHPDVLTYQKHKRTIQTLGWWCTQCGEGILSGKSLIDHTRAFQQFKAEVDHVLGPAAVAKVRKTLGISQRRAGELLGGGPRAFQKYEAGIQGVSAPMSHLLCLLKNDPTRLKELEPPKRVVVASSRKRQEKSSKIQCVSKSVRRGVRG